MDTLYIILIVIAIYMAYSFFYEKRRTTNINQ